MSVIQQLVISRVKLSLLLIPVLLCAVAPLPVRSFVVERRVHVGSRNIQRREASSFKLTMASVTSTTNVPNWRTIPLKDVERKDEARRMLNDRGYWTQSDFQDALSLYDRFVACSDSYVAGHIEAALNTLDHAYRLYGPQSVICSFNGGKDAVVILELVRAAHAHYYQTLLETNGKNVGDREILRPRVIYFNHDDEFPEIIEFLETSVKRYNLEMVAFENGIKFPVGLEVLVENNFATPDSEVRLPISFVLGTRTSDPNAGSQGHFAPSSHYMPPFMRVNPILDWSYGHVWHFLRLFELPYCSLYDMGYTSLGTTKDTLPCPALAVAGSQEGGGLPRYWPAYMLRDYDQERAGRIKKDKSQKTPVKKVARVSTDTDDGEDTTSSDRLSTFSAVRVAGKADESEKQDDLDHDEASVVSYSTDQAVLKTVGILIIGDEILKGFTADTNTQTAAKALREQNVFLKRVVVVSDDADAIVKEIGRLRKEVDVVITSGGVGPTHDDVTIKSVAAALDCEMILHEEMAQLLRDKMNDGDRHAKLTEAQTKMATLPSSSKLRYLSEDPNAWPVLQCRNIFILPGVPEFFATKIESVAKYLSCQLQRSVAYKVVLRVDENSIVPALNAVVENHPDVVIGSYPFVSHPDFKTVITVEGRLVPGGAPPKRSNSALFNVDQIENPKSMLDQCVQLALNELITTLPEGSVLRVDNDDIQLFS